MSLRGQFALNGETVFFGPEVEARPKQASLLMRIRQGIRASTALPPARSATLRALCQREEDR